MTHSPFAANDFTTRVDRGRRYPVLSKEQIARILMFWLAVTATIWAMDRRPSHAADRTSAVGSAKHQAQTDARHPA